jgi:hypothetical protein
MTWEYDDWMKENAGDPDAKMDNDMKWSVLWPRSL